MFTRILILLAFCMSFAWAPVSHARPYRVVASFSILGDMAHQIGGGEIDLATLVKPDQDAHAFQPSPDDAKRIAEADMVIVNGLGFEGWIDRLIKSSGFKGTVVIASTGITPRRLDLKTTDPHAWQDLSNGRIYAQNIAAALAQALPEHKAVFAARLSAYQSQMAQMDSANKKLIAVIPPLKRKIITSHDAFGYLGVAYGITFLSPQGIDTEAEASAQDVAKLIAQIRREKVKQVFIENMSNPQLIARIATESGARLGGSLFSDALSGPDGAAPSYLDMFRHNLPLIAAAMKETGD